MIINELQFRLIVYFIIIEFIIILSFIIASYVSKLYFFIKKRSNKKAYDNLQDLILQNKPIPSYLAKNVEIGLRVLKKLNQKIFLTGKKRELKLYAI